MTADQYWVYLLASRSRRLYVGSTSNILRRVMQHRDGRGAEHCRKYSIDRLVYFETAPSHREALARERQVKSWSRAKKVTLIEQVNLGWRDLAVDWLPKRGE
ncbi:MAG: GIY-YIG nuclease family protein [Gemmatimonadales bacterium]